MIFDGKELNINPTNMAKLFGESKPKAITIDGHKMVELSDGTHAVVGDEHDHQIILSDNIVEISLPQAPENQEFEGDKPVDEISADTTTPETPADNEPIANIQEYMTQFKDGDNNTKKKSINKIMNAIRGDKK